MIRRISRTTTLIVLLLSLSGCSDECDTYRGEKTVVCLKCFPKSTIIVCVPCKKYDNTSYCRPHCEECGGHYIRKMTDKEINERKRMLGYR